MYINAVNMHCPDMSSNELDTTVAKLRGDSCSEQWESGFNVGTVLAWT